MMRVANRRHPQRTRTEVLPWNAENLRMPERISQWTNQLDCMEITECGGKNMVRPSTASNVYGWTLHQRELPLDRMWFRILTLNSPLSYKIPSALPFLLPRLGTSTLLLQWWVSLHFYSLRLSVRLYSPRLSCGMVLGQPLTALHVAGARTQLQPRVWVRKVHVRTTFCGDRLIPTFVVHI